MENERRTLKSNDLAAEYRRGRLSEALREEISEIVRFELGDERIDPVAVNHVALNPKLNSARVYVSGAGVACDIEGTVAALNRAAQYIQRQVTFRLHLRKAPTLHFVFDKTMVAAMRIEEILDEESARLSGSE